MLWIWLKKHKIKPWRKIINTSYDLLAWTIYNKLKLKSHLHEVYIYKCLLRTYLPYYMCKLNMVSQFTITILLYSKLYKMINEKNTLILYSFEALFFISLCQIGTISNIGMTIRYLMVVLVKLLWMSVFQMFPKGSRLGQQHIPHYYIFVIPPHRVVQHYLRNK